MLHENIRETSTVALWNEHADLFEAEQYMEMAARGPVVLLFVGLTCSLYDGNFRTYIDMLNIMYTITVNLAKLTITKTNVQKNYHCKVRIYVNGMQIQKFQRLLH